MMCESVMCVLVPPPFASTCTCAYVCACTSLSLQLGKAGRLRHRQRKAQPWLVYQSLIALQLRTDCCGKQGGSLWVCVHLNTPHIFCRPLTPTGSTSINNKTQSRQLNHESVCALALVWTLLTCVHACVCVCALKRCADDFQQHPEILHVTVFKLRGLMLSQFAGWGMKYNILLLCFT